MRRSSGRSLNCSRTHAHLSPVGEADFKGWRGRSAVIGSGLSGGESLVASADRRPGAAPRLGPFLVAQSSAARASPFPTIDGFSLADNTQSTISTHASDRARGRRSRDQDIPCVSTRLTAPHRHSAMASAERKAVPRSQAQEPFHGTLCRNYHRGRAAGSAAVGQRAVHC